MADLDDVLRVVSETLVLVKMHDQKVDFSVAAMRESQGRIADAMEKMTTATLALQSATETLLKRNGEPVAVKPHWEWTPKMLLWLAGGSLLVGISMKGGSEVVQVLVHALTGK